ncbi:N-acetylneuraminate synthase family protein [Crocinitomix sp.]|nr:N-acetylneuraminate synthase family protein [Crocinitomix sp.]
MNFKQSIKINKSTIGVGNRPYIIAEMACAHNGDFQQALDLIKASKEAGADASQLQFFVPEETVTPNHPVYQVLQDIAFTKEEWLKIFEYGKSLDIDMWVCTYDVPSVQWATEFGASGIKLNSADLANPDVLKAVAESKIPFTLGTGASTFEEISRGLRYTAQHGADSCVLMQGVQNFPTQNKDLNIARIKLLQNTFGIPVGYADHTDGDDPYGNIIDLIAIGCGAVILEKHITLDRSKKGIDYQAALNPDEFEEYVQTMHKGAESFGVAEIKEFSESDLKYRKFQKKGIVAARNLAIGETITRDKVSFIRNEVPGVAPIDFPNLDGKVLTKAIKQFDNILLNDIN